MMRKKRHKSTNKLFNKLLALKLLLLAVSILIFATIYQKSYRYFGPININTVPLIKKDYNEIKIQPVNAEGLIISHQDKVIYERLKGNTQKPAEYHIPKSLSQYKNADEALMILRATQLQDECAATDSIFDIINADVQDAILFFGDTATKEAAETKRHRIATQYATLLQKKFIIIQLSKEKYRLKMDENIALTDANAICKEMNKNGDECYAEHKK